MGSYHAEAQVTIYAKPFHVTLDGQIVVKQKIGDVEVDTDGNLSEKSISL